MTYIKGHCIRPLLHRVVEEGVTCELWHQEQQSWPQDPKQSSNDRNVEHEGHRQEEERNVACVVVVARSSVAIRSKKTLTRNQSCPHIRLGLANALKRLLHGAGTAYQIEVGELGNTDHSLHP
jgi:hypothetical protein